MNHIRNGTSQLTWGTACLWLWTVFCPVLVDLQAGYVPGVVIDHLPAVNRIYVGSPSLAVLPSGEYIASHDEFGPASTEHTKATTQVFISEDQGETWAALSTIQGQFWSKLFAHNDALYILGTDRHHGDAIIRRSLDKGRTWTDPINAKNGLLSGEGQYHCAPMPVLVHAGRLWRPMERRIPPEGWGGNYRAGMLSVPVDADLLDASNWTFSHFLPSSREWNQEDMRGWLEGNPVLTPTGEVVDMLRVDTASFPEKAALVRVSADGKTTQFDPDHSLIDFPGGAKKFAVRHDPVSGLYWSLATIVPQPYQDIGRRPAQIRNTLALTASADLTHWTVRAILLHHPDPVQHGFQYVDWRFDGEDIIAVCRTAYDDGQGGAHNNHDANFLTFHRFANFRDLTEPPWRSLPLISDGKIAPGWMHIGYGGFEVDDGALRTECSPKGLGLLVYREERLGNCQIRVVFKSKDARSNAGVYVRIADGILKEGDRPGAAFDRGPDGQPSDASLEKVKASAERDEGPWYAVHHGYEVQITDAGDPMHRTGSIYSLAPSSGVSSRPPNEWKSMIITLAGKEIFVNLDGKRVTHFDPDSPDLPAREAWHEPKREPERPLAGYIGLQNHDPGDVVWFKEVSVRPLPDFQVE